MRGEEAGDGSKNTGKAGQKTNPTIKEKVQLKGKG